MARLFKFKHRIYSQGSIYIEIEYALIHAPIDNTSEDNRLILLDVCKDYNIIEDTIKDLTKY